jgi:hypothetical protein
MGNYADASPDEIRAAYAEILPYERDRKLLCEQLLKSVAYCEDAGSPGWSVSLLQRGFRLNVGQVEALTCFYTGWDKETFELDTDVGFIDFRFLVSGPDALRVLGDFDPDMVVPMNYRSVPEPHWCVVIPLHVEGPDVDAERDRTMREFAAVQPCHQHFVAAAARSRTGAPRQRSNFARYHCEGLMTYARDETSPPIIITK